MTVAENVVSDMNEVNEWRPSWTQKTMLGEVEGDAEVEQQVAWEQVERRDS